MVGQKWALVVGISQFQPGIGAERLQSAAADAEAFAALLRDPNVGRFPAESGLPAHQRPGDDLSDQGAAQSHRHSAKPEDMVVVYISTHGSSRANDLRKVSYLYTYDTDVRSRDQIFGTALAMVEVSGIISNRCVAQRTVVIFDTCHSGSSRALTTETSIACARARAATSSARASRTRSHTRTQETGSSPPA